MYSTCPVTLFTKLSFVSAFVRSLIMASTVCVHPSLSRICFMSSVILAVSFTISNFILFRYLSRYHIFSLPKSFSISLIFSIDSCSSMILKTDISSSWSCCCCFNFFCSSSHWRHWCLIHNSCLILFHTWFICNIRG